jgi:hypothetical protein
MMAAVVSNDTVPATERFVFLDTMAPSVGSDQDWGKK